jgi:hypothetical protein
VRAETCQRVWPHDHVCVHENNDASKSVAGSQITRRSRSRLRAGLEDCDASRARKGRAAVRRAVIYDDDFIIGKIRREECVKASFQLRAAVINRDDDCE